MSISCWIHIGENMSEKHTFGLAVAGMIALTLAACAGSPTQAVTPIPPGEPAATSTSAPSASYDDPYAYCAAMGTLDAPDSAYTGPAMPDSLVDAMVAAGIVTADAPPEFKKNAVWRCANKHVMICHFGADLPCQEKADLSMTPSPEMADFCKANPASDVIPAVVTGRATVYEWTCDKDAPVASGQVLKVDAQGFLADFWYELPNQ